MIERSQKDSYMKYEASIYLLIVSLIDRLAV